MTTSNTPKWKVGSQHKKSKKSPESYSTRCDEAIANPHAGRVGQDGIDHLHVLFSQAGQRIVDLGHSLGHLLQDVDILHLSN